MVSHISLKNNLTRAYPQFSFQEGESFYWNPTDKTVFYASLKSEKDKLLLLHELSHGILNHLSYNKDIELLQMERDAWDMAASLADQYGVQYDLDVQETSIDTYRDWLHSRSICPMCSATGIQTSLLAYACIVCGGKWRVNHARTCHLKRYKISK